MKKLIWAFVGLALSGCAAMPYQAMPSPLINQYSIQEQQAQQVQQAQQAQQEQQAQQAQRIQEEENYKNNLQAWVGHRERELIESCGVPDSVYPIDAQTKVIKYQRATTFNIGGFATGFLMPGGLIDVDVIPPSNLTFSCVSEFTISNGIISNWRAEGNSCRMPSDPNIFLEVTADKATAAIDEKIKVDYILYTRYDTKYEGFLTQGKFDGFRTDYFLNPINSTNKTTDINGKKYIKAVVYSLNIYPISKGDLIIEPGSIKVSVKSNNGSARREIIIPSKSIAIHVK